MLKLFGGVTFETSQNGLHLHWDVTDPTQQAQHLDFHVEGETDSVADENFPASKMRMIPNDIVDAPLL